MNTDKICRCCLALDAPLLSIYDGGSAGMGCVADMLSQIAKIMPRPGDNMPEKTCLQCISEINRCFVFKMKCENSNRTLRQLLPEALPESFDFAQHKVDVVSSAVQTDDKIFISSLVQTEEEDKPLTSHRSSQTIKEEKTFVYHKEVQTERELFCSDGTGFESQENFDNFILYEGPENSDKKAKRRIQSSENEVSKKIFLESSNVNNKLAEEEEPQTVAQQTTAYILLEDSNCSQEPEVYAPSIDDKKYSECDEYEYFEEEIDEMQDEQKNVIYEDDYSNENFKTHTIYEIESSDGKTKSDDEAEAIIKPRNNSKSKPKGQYKCSQCIMTFVSMKVLKRHLANRHEIKDAELIIDYVPHTETEEIIEDTCTDTNAKLINTKAELTPENVAKPQLMPREKATVTNDEVPTNVKYFCDHCQAGFAQRKTLTYHMKHQVCMTSNFKCNICQSIFVSEENLKTHKLTHENPHKCLECDTVCKTIEDLSNHMITIHNRSARNQCHVCKKVFTMKTSLIDHLRIHSGEKPFLCTICGKSFRQNSNLRQHLIRHTNEKNFKCDMCPNAYVTKAELFSHKRTHTGEHPFKCDICQARFTTSCALKKHERKHTGERPYACEFCPMRFAALNVLKNHRRIHTGEKPYKCAHCAKTFTQKGDCLIHERTHLNENYKCFCKSSFIKKSNLTYHIKTRHSEYSENEIQALLEKATDEIVDDVYQSSLIENIDNSFAPAEEKKTSTNTNEELLEVVIEEVC